MPEPLEYETPPEPPLPVPPLSPSYRQPWPPAIVAHVWASYAGAAAVLAFVSVRGGGVPGPGCCVFVAAVFSPIASIFGLAGAVPMILSGDPARWPAVIGLVTYLCVLFPVHRAKLNRRVGRWRPR